ncbi:MAG: hypothetical protein JSS81_18945 [Acidobacteria bacterium]|nr:hypothetical protein [Acidobacteriota bacterium]
MGETSMWAERTVKNTLTDSDTLKIKPFSFSGIGFDIRTFPVLKTYIDSGKIKVEYDSAKNGMAEYDYKTNTIIMGFRFASTYTETALVVHECVHAVYDVVSQKMTTAISEAIAYIVQCQYVYANAGPGKRLSSKDPKKDSVFQKAWMIAAAIQEGKTFTKLDKSNLIAAVSEHPYYAKNATADAGFDGV